ncbi:unnamed protein product [Aspergillus oryzae var. brunneus]|uniref:Unnamed protein product n=2 Tax=Aspergillus oryzae TaxID=5062 RepID=A0AAN4YJ64_ASPOZ|nr:unnamed protein product [Aspergillus oryzae]GMG52574.1 unnamed protein product [Aspergillus oryzae var. brunneus]
MIVPANQLPLFNIRPQIQLKAPRRPRLGMQMPIRIRNLQNTISLPSFIQNPTHKEDEGKKAERRRENSPPQDPTWHPHAQKSTP